MIIPMAVRLDNISLLTGETIISTDYEIATDDKMENIIAFSYNDTVDKYMKVFEIDAQDGRTYYSRARCILSSGPVEYGNIATLTYKTDSGLFDALPSPINIPEITTNYWSHEHPHSNFTLVSSNFEVVGDSKQIQSQWTITKVDTGELVDVFDKTFDFNYLTVIKQLEERTQYKISVSYKSNAGVWSREGSLIITTGEYFNTTGKVPIVSTIETETTIFKTNTYKINSTHEWGLYDKFGNKISPDGTDISAVSSFNILSSWLSPGTTYLLYSREIITSEISGKRTYITITTSPNTQYGLPGEFPFKLGFGSTEESISTLNDTKE